MKVKRARIICCLRSGHVYLLVLVIIATSVWHALLVTVYTPKEIFFIDNERKHLAESEYDNIPVHIIPRQMKFIINHPDICHSEKYFLLGFIHSAIRNKQQRDAIRETWLKELQRHESTYGKVAFFFVLGNPYNITQQQQIENEDAEYGDIIQADFRDTYHNLTMKHLSLLRWVTDYCENSTEWMFKGDDDVIMNTYKIFPFLKKYGHTHNKQGALLCYVMKNPVVFRTGKYKVSRSIYPATRFPDFCSGTAVFMTLDVAKQLYQTSLEIAPLFIDDAAITGIARLKARIKINRIPYRLQYRHFTMWDEDPVQVFQKASEYSLPYIGNLQGLKNEFTLKNKSDIMRSIWNVIVIKEERSGKINSTPMKYH